MTAEEHYVGVYYTTDDDGIWLKCQGCGWQYNAGYWPTPEVLMDRTNRHRRIVQSLPKDRDA